MIKTKYLASVMGALMLLGAALPAQAAALTSAQISAVISLLQAFNVDQATIATVQAELNGQTPSVPDVNASCAAFANLKRGDTDATTGGKVSVLQKMIGIYPPTGYYGVLTSIGYTNKCVGGNTQPTSVSGMSMYTDPSFGFSFWYPSGWMVTRENQINSPWIPITDGTITSILDVGTASQPKMISIEEAVSPNMRITDTGGAGPIGPITYYFDGHNWIQSTFGQGDSTPVGSSVEIAITNFNNTIGGLHMFAGTSRFDTNIIPLSATHFVVVNDGGGASAQYLAKTIVATDPTVAIPVSTTQQVATIQAEAAAYGVSSSNTQTQTYTNTQSGFSLQYPSSVTVNPDCAEGEPVCRNNPSIVFYEKNLQTVSNGFAEGYVAANAFPNSNTAACTGGPATWLTINGISFASFKSGSGAAGTLETNTSYTTLRGNTCYSISLDEYSHDQGGPVSSSQAQADLESIVQSFRFLQ